MFLIALLTASFGRRELWKADTCFEIAFLRQSHYLCA
jgi:hypothetical protein